MRAPNDGANEEPGPVVAGAAVKAGEVRVGSAVELVLKPSGPGGAGVDVAVRMTAVEEHEAEESAPESGFVGFLRYTVGSS